MEDINHLIEKFWQGQATTEEMKYLLVWLDHHGNTWRDTLNKAFIQDLDASAEAEWRDEQAQLLWHRINQVITTEHTVVPIMEKKRRSFGWTALVAASFILVVMGALFFWSQREINRQSASPQQAKIFETVNRHPNVLSFTLPDQSAIKLSTASSIRYDEGFGITNRDIELKGEAYFNVAKLGKLPFTVYANDIMTTALGTEFVVQTMGLERISIRLVSGKVVVTSQKSSGLKMNRVYLKPGQELQIDKKRALAKLTHIKPIAHDRGPHVTKTERYAPHIPLYFDKEPLSQVFAQLSARFHQPFVYNKQQLETILFTGSYAPNDKLLPWLKAVSRMNGLDCKQQNGIIYIHPVAGPIKAIDTVATDH